MRHLPLLAVRHLPLLAVRLLPPLAVRLQRLPPPRLRSVVVLAPSAERPCKQGGVFKVIVAVQSERHKCFSSSFLSSLHLVCCYCRLSWLGIEKTLLFITGLELQSGSVRSTGIFCSISLINEVFAFIWLWFECHRF